MITKVFFDIEKEPISKIILAATAKNLRIVFTPQAVKAVQVLVSPMVSVWVDSGKKLVWTRSQKP